MAETLTQRLERSHIREQAHTQRLLRAALDELRILHAAWVIAEDDDRRRKALYIGPTTARKWRKLIQQVARDE